MFRLQFEKSFIVDFANSCHRQIPPGMGDEHALLSEKVQVVIESVLCLRSIIKWPRDLMSG